MMLPGGFYWSLKKLKSFKKHKQCLSLNQIIEYNERQIKLVKEMYIVGGKKTRQRNKINWGAM